MLVRIEVICTVLTLVHIGVELTLHLVSHFGCDIFRRQFYGAVNAAQYSAQGKQTKEHSIRERRYALGGIWLCTAGVKSVRREVNSSTANVASYL